MGSSRGLQWLSLVGIIWLQTINGTNSTFPAYSSQFKTLLSLSQIQLNNLAFASDAGKLLGFVAGIGAAYLPLWVVLLMGSLLGLVGYGLQYLFLTHYISSLSYAHIFLLNVLAGNSICWINTVCYVVTIRNFSPLRHVAVGLTTSYTGLSAKVYTDAVDALFATSPSQRAQGYLLLNSVLPLLVCLVAAPLLVDLNLPTHHHHPNQMRPAFGFMFAITIATGTYSVITSLGLVTMSTKTGIAFFTLALLLAPLVIPFTISIRDLLAERNIAENKAYNINSMITNHNTSGTSACREEIGARVMFTRIDFWLYFMVYLCGATIGLVYMNNLGQVAESRGLSTSTSLVSVSASFGFFGRLLPSITDHFLSSTRWWRIRGGPGYIALQMFPMGVALLMVGMEASRATLYASTGVIGVCTGAIVSISVSTTAELFGERSLGVNHNVVVANIPIGSFVFGYMAALVYHHAQYADGKCMGMGCFRATFVIWASLCCIGTIMALLLAVRTRNFYCPTKNISPLP